MGYDVQNRGSSFFISRKNKAAAAAALREYNRKAVLVRDTGYDTLPANATLEDILSEWCWGFEEDKNGNITYVYLDDERLGDEEDWFPIIAPYVKEGSYIAFEGEDGFIWCYYFDGENCTEHRGEIVFPTIPNDNSRGEIKICT